MLHSWHKALKSIKHLIAALGLASASVLFVAMWYISGDSCWGISSSCFSVSRGNATFVSAGLLSLYLAAVEIVAFSRTRKEFSPFPSLFEKEKKYRVASVGSMLAGLILAIYSTFMLNVILTPCPASACSSVYFWGSTAMEYLLLYAGQLLLAFGATFFLVTRLKQFQFRVDPVTIHQTV